MINFFTAITSFFLFFFYLVWVGGSFGFCFCCGLFGWFFFLLRMGFFFNTVVGGLI